MHPFQMDALAKQRWDELVAHGGAHRHNRRRAKATRPRLRARLHALLSLLP